MRASSPPAAILSLLVSLTLTFSAVHAQQWQAIAPGLRAKPLASATTAPNNQSTRFVSLPTAATGVDFINRIDWNHPQGQLFSTSQACGGLAVGDVDNNGLADLFFVSALEKNRLYLQAKPWQFTPAPLQSTASNNPWSTSAVLFDIDNDSDLDLYVCNYDSPNQLYINRGDGTFDERAAHYGLDLVDACLMPSVADYDRDGDLDIYLAINRYHVEKKFDRQDLFYWHQGQEFLRPAAQKYFTIRRHPNRATQLNMWAGRTDRLLRNEGPGQKFTDVSEQMNLERGDTLSATWWDYDHDQWPDLYVCNDLAAPDRLFHNNRDGSFTDVALNSLPHSPWMAMGSSAGDINNDGLVDLLAADMSFRTHFKDKVFMGDMSTKFRAADYFPHRQSMRNMLLLNTGTDHFQEAAYLAGLASTDWTWTAKLADFDNDGRLDAYFTNGSPINLSQSYESAPPSDSAGAIDTRLLRQRYRQLPPVPEQNLVYQNLGDLQFKDQSHAWGLDHVGMSYAAVHADLDRDGDLDLVVANLEQPPLLYRNDSSQRGTLIQLQGNQSNRHGLGAEIIITTDQGRQLRQVYPVAGFLACQEPLTHFGLGSATTIQQLKVRWPSGTEQLFTDLKPNQHYLIQEPTTTVPLVAEVRPPSLYTPVNTLTTYHHEEPYDDFARQPLLANKLSQLGPPMAWGDVDADGDPDLYLGEGSDWPGMIYLNRGDLQFTPQPQASLARDAAHEDSAALFFDANGDGHLDLYVGSGSVECQPGDAKLRDRLYFGDGQGQFQSAPADWLPDLRLSTGAIVATDFDADGHTDLILGTRSIPGQYPLAPTHALLRNTGSRFVNVLSEVAPQLADAGMITDLVAADFNADGRDDLLVATDWGPLRLYLNQQGKFLEATDRANLSRWSGWWQSLAVADLNRDGHLDFVAGNFGLNTKYKASPTQPVLAYYGQYGDSHSRNFIEASYEGETLFPIRGKSCSSAAMPHLTKQFKTYEAFAAATLSEIYTPRCLQQAQRYEVNTLASACFLNDGHGRFTRHDLPTAAQLAPIFAIAITDANADSIPDLLLAQNFYSPQRETGPHNGGLSLLALGQGDGTFSPLRPDRSGLAIPGDAKAAAALDLNGDNHPELCLATNNGPLYLFSRSPVTPEDLNSANSWTQTNLALAAQLLDSEQYQQALPYLRRTLKVDPHNVDALLQLTTVRRHQQRYAEAQKLLDRARGQRQTDSLPLLLAAGQLLHSQKQYDRALETLRQAEALDPADQRVHLHLGDTLFAQGRLSDAQHHYQLAQRLDKLAAVAEQRQVAQLLYRQARQQHQQQNEQQALRLYQKSRRLNAQHRPTLKHLAQLLTNAKDPNLRDPWLANHLEKIYLLPTRK